MLHTVLRWTLVIILIPAVVFLVATPAEGFLGDVAIIANQVTQIGQAVTMIGVLRAVSNKATETNSELAEQIAQLSDMYKRAGDYVSTLNQARTIAQNPAALLGSNAAWANDFPDPETTRFVNVLTSIKEAGANDMTTHWRTVLSAADQVGEADILDLFANVGAPNAGQAAADAFTRGRQRIDSRIATDYAALDAAETLAELTQAAQDNLDDLRDDANDNPEDLQETDLAQLQLTGQLSAAELAVARAQLATYQAMRETLERQQAEQARRDLLTRWVEEEIQAADLNNAHEDVLRTRSEAMDNATLLTSWLGPIR